MVDSLTKENSNPDQSGPGITLASLGGDIRQYIPTLGLREYWWPAIMANKVPKKKPVQVSMLGDDICFFIGADGQPAAIQDICPHRGARLSEGRVHWNGTVTCPYHGWVYNQHGTNVAVLSEGPDSLVCGKPGTEAKKYPTQVLKGMVFVWMGEGEPAPIEEDVPEEFFDDKSLVLHGMAYWNCNWEVALENSMDSHVNYLHRDAFVVLRGSFFSRGAPGEHVFYVGNGFGPDLLQTPFLTSKPPAGDYYPQHGWKWPQHNYRKLWTWLFKWNVSGAMKNVPAPNSPRWCFGHHLPGMFRAEFAYDLYTRVAVPVTENKTRVYYYHYTQPKNKLQRWWQTLLYHVYHKWVIEGNFSTQDTSVMTNQKFDWPEKLSGTDAEVIQWRKLILTKHLGGRDAHFEHRNPDGIAPDEVPIERLSIKYLPQLQEMAKARYNGNGNGNGSEVR